MSNVRALSRLGYSYKNGEGVEKDYQQALAWYHKAAEKGDTGSQNYT